MSPDPSPLTEICAEDLVVSIPVPLLHPPALLQERASEHLVIATSTLSADPAAPP